MSNEQNSQNEPNDNLGSSEDSLAHQDKLDAELLELEAYLNGSLNDTETVTVSVQQTPLTPQTAPEVPEFEEFSLNNPGDIELSLNDILCIVAEKIGQPKPVPSGIESVTTNFAKHPRLVEPHIMEETIRLWIDTTAGSVKQKDNHLPKLINALAENMHHTPGSYEILSRTHEQLTGEPTPINILINEKLEGLLTEQLNSNRFTVSNVPLRGTLNWHKAVLNRFGIHELTQFRPGELTHYTNLINLNAALQEGSETQKKSTWEDISSYVQVHELASTPKESFVTLLHTIPVNGVDPGKLYRFLLKSREVLGDSRTHKLVQTYADKHPNTVIANQLIEWRINTLLRIAGDPKEFYNQVEKKLFYMVERHGRTLCTAAEQAVTYLKTYDTEQHDRHMKLVWQETRQTSSEYSELLKLISNPSYTPHIEFATLTGVSQFHTQRINESVSNKSQKLVQNLQKAFLQRVYEARGEKLPKFKASELHGAFLEHVDKSSNTRTYNMEQKPSWLDNIRD